MENWGNIRGYNNNSGFLYTLNGMYIAGDTKKEQLNYINNGMPYKESQIRLPNYYTSRPQYENTGNVKKMLSYMNNGLVIKNKGKKVLTLPKSLSLAGGVPTNKDYNNI